MKDEPSLARVKSQEGRRQKRFAIGHKSIRTERLNRPPRWAPHGGDLYFRRRAPRPDGIQDKKKPRRRWRLKKIRRANPTEQIRRNSKSDRGQSARRVMRRSPSR